MSKWGPKDIVDYERKKTRVQHNVHPLQTKVLGKLVSQNRD